jgi:hypothetical protein
MSPKINIVTGNHAGHRGIEDYVHFLNFSLKQLGYTISESLNPQKDVAANIWIEDFSAFRDPRVLFNSDTAPHYIVCTEFPSGFRSFNIFGLRDKLFAIINHVFPIRYIARNIFFQKHYFSFAKLFFFPLALLGYALNLKSAETMIRVLLVARFINLRIISNQVAGFIVINEHLKYLYEKQFPSVPSYVLTPLLPEFVNSISSDKLATCFFSGQSTTGFRKNWIIGTIKAQSAMNPINSLARYALREDKSRLYNDFTTIVSSLSKSSTNGVFIGKVSPADDLPDPNNDSLYILCEVYIGQTRKWLYASPMRVYRALRTGCLPVSAGKYIEDIFDDLVINAPKKPDNFIRFIQTYNYGEFIKLLPNLIESHNIHYLPLNRATTELFLPKNS